MGRGKGKVVLSLDIILQQNVHRTPEWEGRYENWSKSQDNP